VEEEKGHGLIRRQVNEGSVHVEGDAGCRAGGQRCLHLALGGGTVVSGAKLSRPSDHLRGGSGVGHDGDPGGSLQGEAQQPDLTGGVGQSPQFAEPFSGGLEVAGAQPAVR